MDNHLLAIALVLLPVFSFRRPADRYGAAWLMGLCGILAFLPDGAALAIGYLFLSVILRLLTLRPQTKRPEGTGLNPTR